MKKTPVKSTAQAKKMLYDYMDEKRPWASCTSVYDMMEGIVAYAAFAFCDERIITPELVEGLEKDLLRFTEPLISHPDNYDGPCACEECR